MKATKKTRQKAKAQPRRLMDQLVEIDRAGGRVDGAMTYIYHPAACRYLSGVPYLWTGFGERAFVFADEGQAEKLIRDYPELAGCEVRQFRRWG